MRLGKKALRNVTVSVVFKYEVTFDKFDDETFGCAMQKHEREIIKIVCFTQAE